MQKSKYPYLNRSLKSIKGELWEDIPSFDGAYQISNFGRIKAIRRWVEREDHRGFWLREKILAQKVYNQKVCDGKRILRRLTVSISYDRKKQHIAVARMVYFLFVRKFVREDRTLFVSYKDGDPFNICIRNLVLTTPSATITNAYKNKNRDLIMFGNDACALTQYELTGKKLQTFDSISSASKATGITATSLGDAIKRIDGFSSGYIWRKGKCKNDIIDVHKSIKKRIASEQLHDSFISQYDLTGKKIKEYNNLKEAAKAVKTQPNSIRLILLGKAFTSKGFHWQAGKGKARINMQPILEKRLEKLRKGICRPVTQYDLKGNKVKTYRSITEAAAAINVHNMSVHAALNRDKPRSYKGYLWRYSGEKLISFSILKPGLCG